MGTVWESISTGHLWGLHGGSGGGRVVVRSGRAIRMQVMMRFDVEILDGISIWL